MKIGKCKKDKNLLSKLVALHTYAVCCDLVNECVMVRGPP